MKREWLSDIPQKKNMTQEQVAAQAFLNRSYYSLIETGKRNPSFNIAINIAKVLDFDPMRFFDEQVEFESDFSDDVTADIHTRLKETNTGDILYLYDKNIYYIENVITFIATGMERGSTCIIIDDTSNLTLIDRKLKETISTPKREKMILLLPIKKLSNGMSTIQKLLETSPSVRLWWGGKRKGPPRDITSRLYDKKNKASVLFLCSYNASAISAASYIQLMRIYRFLMTDHELIESPFYLSEDQHPEKPDYIEFRLDNVGQESRKKEGEG
ncbi:helix-turn-helix domain-containing protein [Thalassobacillus devorans]|uniref:helix-turn-helix domain-containing protein n=1 Tax=Thalassobacillus devorans TaxID=279813 RepID=UPI000A1C8705|nr:helix-turn-helix transcriptional regulator [Thalassobacillus devorans]